MWSAELRPMCRWASSKTPDASFLTCASESKIGATPYATKGTRARCGTWRKVISFRKDDVGSSVIWSSIGVGLTTTLGITIETRDNNVLWDSGGLPPRASNFCTRETLNSGRFSTYERNPSFARSRKAPISSSFPSARYTNAPLSYMIPTVPKLRI
jgi:hypothetical protein